MAQVAHAADVDVAHRVVVRTHEDGEEVEVLRGSLHGVVWVLQAAQLHLRFQEAVLLPRRADGGHVLPWVGQQVDLGARVVVPKLLQREAVLPESVAVRGAGWYPKVSLAAMLDLGVCRWDHIVLGISARSHVDAARAGAHGRRLARGRGAHGQAQRERDDRPVGAQHGGGLQRAQQQQRAGRRGRGLLSGLRGMVWDFVYARRLLSNGTYRPIHDAVLGFEHCMVAKARRILDAPPRYLAQVKTDCLLTQRLPKRFTERLRALEAPRHPDGTPVYRVEEMSMEAERPKQRRWNGVDDPISHCLAGNSLLLTGLPGAGKTHLARTIVARLREQGEAVHLVSKTHCSAQNLGLGAQTADHWVRRYVRGGSAQKLDWLVVEEITQLDMALWADLACVGLNASCRPCWNSGPGGPSAPLEHSQLIRDLAGGRRHELTENMRSDPGIFNFVKWLRVGEEACPTLGAGQGEAEGALPFQARVAGHHAGHQPQQAHGRERSGEPGPGAGGLKAPRAGSHGATSRYQPMGVAKLRPKTARRA